MTSPALALPRENVYGHTKKLLLIRSALDELRSSLRRPLRVLDIGCGNGSALTRFLPQSGDHVLGIDMHAPSIDYAQQRFGSSALSFQVMRAEDLTQREQRFDAIVLADVLEHLDDPGQLLRVAAGLLAPEGRVLVTVPNGFGPFEFESALSRAPLIGPLLMRAFDVAVAVMNKAIFVGAWSRVVTPSDVPYNLESPHVQFFRPGSFRKMVHAAGMVPVRQCNLSWLSGPFTNYLIAPSLSLCRLNNFLADGMPSMFVSAWFFELRAQKGQPQ